MKLAGVLVLLLSLAACNTENPSSELEAENTALRNKVETLEKRLAALETSSARMEGRLAQNEENLRDVAAVVDRVTVRLDRVER